MFKGSPPSEWIWADESAPLELMLRGLILERTGRDLLTTRLRVEKLVPASLVAVIFTSKMPDSWGTPITSNL